MFGDLRPQVMKNIENFVNLEHQKPPKKMKLGWVNEVSEISMTYDANDSATLLTQS